MNKKEAIQAMQEGKKITHKYFTPEEWMTMRKGMIVLEDRVVCTPEEFWKWRTAIGWDYGYKLIN